MTYPCTGCGKHLFGAPTLCYWCRHPERDATSEPWKPTEFEVEVLRREDTRKRKKKGPRPKEDATPEIRPLLL